MWWVSIILAVSTMSFFNIFLREADIWSLKNFLISLPSIIIINYLYWIGYSKAPAFIWAWMLSLIFGAIFAVGIEYFYFKEVDINIKVLIGLFLIMLGLIFIKVL